MALLAKIKGMFGRSGVGAARDKAIAKGDMPAGKPKAKKAMGEKARMKAEGRAKARVARLDARASSRLAAGKSAPKNFLDRRAKAARLTSGH
jgi:hypothetical protein